MKHLTAKEGEYLTQVQPVNEGARVFATDIYLAVTDSEDNWRSATEAEKAQWEADQEKAQAAAQTDGYAPSAEETAEASEEESEATDE